MLSHAILNIHYVTFNVISKKDTMSVILCLLSRLKLSNSKL